MNLNESRNQKTNTAYLTNQSPGTSLFGVGAVSGLSGNMSGQGEARGGGVTIILCCSIAYTCGGAVNKKLVQNN